MKRRIKPGRQMARFMIILLMTIVAWCFVPQMGAPGHAAVRSPEMVLGSESILKESANTDSAQKIWFAENRWDVINYDGWGNEYTKSDGAMTLLSEKALVKEKFYFTNSSSSTSNNYYESVLKKTTEQGSTSIYNQKFTDKEKYAVIPRPLEVEEYSASPPYSRGISKYDTTGRLWSLSAAEAYALPSDSFRRRGGAWWLRSPGRLEYMAASVSSEGKLEYSGSDVTREYGVCPAFHLDIKPILFTSVAENGKSSGAAGADALKPVGETSSNRWKLTLLDDGTANPFLKGHSGFDVSEIVRTENGVSVRYTGAKTGPNEYISAIITDRPFTDSSARITYYGRIKNCVSGDDADGTETINTAGKLRAGDILYIFNEQYNYQEGLYGDKTDYVSKLVEVNIPPVTYTVTFVDGQGNTLKTETVESGNSATAPDDPKREGYTFKGWDKDFSHVTENITVTALWEKNITPTPTPTPDNKAGCILLAKMTAKGSRKLVISWNPIDGAAGYDVFLVKCGKNNMGRPVRTIKGETSLTWTKKSLRKKTPYKAVVKAWTIKDGKKVFVVTSPIVHAYTSGGTRKYTNARSVAVNKTRVSLAIGKTFTVRARVNKIRKGKKLMMKNHAPKLRYLSSNTKIATVNESGIITARAKGSCIIYVIAVNGSRKAITVMVE